MSARPTSGIRHRRRGFPTGRSGCSSTGATTSCGRCSSSGSRTSPTTGAITTSSTSPTAASLGRSRTAQGGCAEGRPERAGSIRTGASSRWCSTRTTRSSSRASRCCSTRMRSGTTTRTRSTSLDNVETTANSVLIQEDPGGHNQGPVNGYAKIWRFPLPAGPPVKVAQVNQSLRPDLADRLVGVERDHRRLVRLRAGLVPRGHPGARLRDRDGAEPVPGHHVHA